MTNILRYLETFQKSAQQQFKLASMIFIVSLSLFLIINGLILHATTLVILTFLGIAIAAMIIFFFTVSYLNIILNGFLLLLIRLSLQFFDIQLFHDLDVLIMIIMVTLLLLYLEKRSFDFKKILETQIFEAQRVNTDLVSIYEELEANDEELRAQYDEILENRNFLQRVQKRNNLLFEASNEVIWELDLKTGKRHFSNATYVDILHLDLIQSIHFEEWAYDLHPNDQSLFVAAMERVRDGLSQSEVFEIRVNDLAGGWKWLKSKVVSLVDEENHVTLMAGSYSDIDTKKKDDEMISNLAYHDPLTGLLNRISLLKTIQNHLDQPIHKICEGVLFYLDIDGFKMVNNTYGHDIGDLLIVQIASRIKEQRPTDDIARFGGADFILLTSDQLICSEALVLADQLQRELSKPFFIGEKEIFLTVSIGISVFSDEAKQAETVLRQADIALRRAKELGKKRCILFERHMSDAVSEKLLMINELRNAVHHNEIYLCFQPQINLETGSIYGFEALCRWENRVYGNVPPLKFIPLAEETGIIVPLGAWIFESACQFLKQAEHLQEGLLISINIASQQLLHPGFNQAIEDIAAQSNISPSNICIEITESSLIESMAVASHNLDKFKQVGFKIALDDFGTGFSSLNYLNQLPIDILKIDKSFTDRITYESKEYSLIKSNMQISADLNLSLIIEGIEDEAQIDILKSISNPIIQGYYYGKPMEAQEALRWIENRNVEPSML